MSLTTCIKAAGAALDAGDKKAIIDRSRALRGEGMAVDEAAKKAVDERIEYVQQLLGQAEAVYAEGKAKAEPVAKPAPAAKVEDFGEKLEGARKDQAPSLRDNLFGEIKTRETDAGTEMFSIADAAPQTDSAAFKRWFGDSKVVNDDGKPLVVYHGTHREFSVFDASAPSSHIPLPGFYFTPNPDIASTFAESGAKMAENRAGRGYSPIGANVVPTYLAMQNPLDVDASAGAMKGFVSEKIIKEVILEAQRKGHDGVILRGWQDGSGPVQYIVFNPEQIKSATGNRGTFDPTNPDITLSVDDGKRSADTAAYGPATQAHTDLANKFAGFLNEPGPDGKPRFSRAIVLDAVAPRSGAVGGRSRELAAVSTVARRLYGREVVFVRFGARRPLFNGAMSHRMPGVVFINADAAHPLLTILGHELLHHLKRDTPAVYKELAARLDKVTMGETRYRDALKSKYEAQGANLPANWMEELHADIVGDFFNDPQFWQDMAKEQPSLFKRVADAIVKFLDDALAKMTGARPFGTEQYITDIKKARAAVVDAMRQFSGTQVGGMSGQSEGINLSTAPSLRTQGIPADVAEIHSARTTDALKTHADYKDAKAGDAEAAARLVSDLVSAKDIEAAKQLGAGVVWVSAHAEEASGRNAIPAMLANLYATKTGGAIENDIVQANRSYHTGADAMQRLISPVAIFGPVVKGARYALVDDVTTMGGTLASLADYIQRNGGKVVGVVTLANTARTPTLPALKPQVSAIERRYGQAVRDIFNIDPGALTRSEAGYILNFRDADALRNRAAAAAQARAERLRAKGLLEDQGLTPPDGGDINLSIAGPTGPAAPPAETPFRTFQRKAQDQFNRFTVIREWAKENGVSLTPDSDVWAYEERMHGRIATRVEDFREKRVKPAIKAIQKAGFTMEQAGEFLHAQHAAERNKQILSVDPTNKAGSGMTDADAAKILAAADPKLKALANDFRKITDETKAILLNAGIVNKDMTDAWDATYKNYVPLKGGDESPAATTGTGKGLGASGKQKRALGHGEREEHIIENILRDHERAITVAEKNTVGQSLIAFVSELANPDIATIGKPEKRKVLVNSTEYEVLDGKGARVAIFNSLEAANKFITKHSQPGLFGAPPVPMTAHKVKGDPAVAFMSTPMLADNEVNVYVKGHAIRVQLNDDLLARAYTRSGTESINRLMALNRDINRYFSMVYTGYNPEFLLTNLARDFGTGTVNITGQFGAGVTAKALANYPASFAHLLRYAATGKETTDIKAYRAAGGSTGASYLSDIERIGKDVQHAYDEYKGAVATFKTDGLLPAMRAATRRWVGSCLLAPIRHLNEAGENAMRMAVFQAVRGTKGYTEDDAASAAKNSTVNFNRRGEWGQVMGAMYLFFNPAIQGTAAIADSLLMGKYKGQALALTGAMGVAAYMLAAAQFGGGDDDDEAWAAIPDNVKDKNVIIRTGKDTYITIPIPYGYGFFYALGNAVYALQKGKSVDKVALNTASNLLEHFSPIGNPLGGDKLDARGLGELVPGAVGGELMRNAVRIATNRNSFGGDIVPDSPFDKDKPDNLKLYRSSKGTMYDKLAAGMNAATGGTKTLSGGVDVSPETLKYWARTVTGGSGGFISDSVGLGGLAARYFYNGDDPDKKALAPEYREIPILRRFLKEESVGDKRRQFWDAVKEVKEAQADLQRARKAHDEAGQAKVWDKRGELVSMAKYADGQTKMVKAQRDLVAEVMADESTSLAYKRARVKAIEKEETEIYAGFVKDFSKEVRKADEVRRAISP